MSSNLVNNKMNNQSQIDNLCPRYRKPVPKVSTISRTLLALKIHQIVGFIKGYICPFCKEPRIIYRSWRDDYLCGGCFEVFAEAEGKVYHLGNQKDLD